MRVETSSVSVHCRKRICWFPRSHLVTAGRRWCILPMRGAKTARKMVKGRSFPFHHEKWLKNVPLIGDKGGSRQRPSRRAPRFSNFCRNLLISPCVLYVAKREPFTEARVRMLFRTTYLKCIDSGSTHAHRHTHTRDRRMCVLITI